MLFIEFLHERCEDREQGRSVGHWEDDELDVGPLSGCSDDVAQC